MINSIQVTDGVGQFLRSRAPKGLKSAYFDFTKNPFVEKALNYASADEVNSLCMEYAACPKLYDDVFQGRVKYQPNGLADEPIPLYKGGGLNEIKDIMNPESLFGKIVRIFDAIDGEKNIVKKISMIIHDKFLFAAIYDSENKRVEEHLFRVKNKEDLSQGSLFKMMNFATDKMVDILRN